MTKSKTPLVLNEDQEAAAQAIFNFLMSDEKEFSVTGPAGTGKTTLMQHVMKTLLPDYENACKLVGLPCIEYEIALTATTNKAAEVLTMATGFPAQTIHSFMNLKVFDDYKTGVSKVSQTRSWQVHSKKLIFVDEASMVDSTLYDFIHKGTDRTCKIIYLGDHCQLAPVFETLSPVYRNQRNSAALTIPVRNAEQPALMALCDQLRENVATHEFLPIDPVPGVIDYVDDREAQDFIDQTFATETTKARVLGYSNARVNEYNEYIRNLRGYPAHFVTGERVINNSGVQVGKDMLRVEEEFEVVSHSDVPETITVGLGGAEMDIYHLSLSNNRFHKLQVRVPADPAHYRALMKHYAKVKDWNAFYWLKNNFPDLRPKDAATVYKAQGSTYETVFLDLANIGKSTDTDQVARMLYVGASRATTRLVLYGKLPARFDRMREEAPALV